MVTGILIILIFKYHSQVVYKLDRLYELQGNQVMNFQCKQKYNEQVFIYLECDDLCTIQLNNTFTKSQIKHEMLYTQSCNEELKIQTTNSFTIIQDFIIPIEVNLSQSYSYTKANTKSVIFYNFNIKSWIDFSVLVDKIEASKSQFSILIAQKQYPHFDNTMQFYTVRQNLFVIDLDVGFYNLIVIGTSNLRYHLQISYQEYISGFILQKTLQPYQTSSEKKQIYLYPLRGQFNVQCQNQHPIVIEPQLNKWILINSDCFLYQEQNHSIFIYYENDIRWNSQFINVIMAIIPPYQNEEKFSFIFIQNDNSSLYMNSLQMDHCNIQMENVICTVSTQVKIVELYVIQQQYLLNPASSIVVYLKANYIKQYIKIPNDRYILQQIVGSPKLTRQTQQLQVELNHNTLLLLYYLHPDAQLLNLHEIHKITSIYHDYQFNNPQKQYFFLYVYPKTSHCSVNGVLSNYQQLDKLHPFILQTNIIILRFHSIQQSTYILAGDQPLILVDCQQIFISIYKNSMFCFPEYYQFTFQDSREQENRHIKVIDFEAIQAAELILARDAYKGCFINFADQLLIGFIRKEIVGIQIFENQYQKITSGYYFIHSQVNQLIINVKSERQLASVKINVQSQDQIEFIDYPDDSYRYKCDYYLQHQQFQLVDLQVYNCLIIDCILKLFIKSFQKDDQITFQTCRNNTPYHNIITQFNDNLFFCSTVQAHNLLIIDGIVQQIFNNRFLVCHSEQCIIYISLNIYAEETIQIIQDHGIYVNLNQLNTFVRLNSSNVIIYMEKKQDIQIYSNTTFNMTSCGSQAQFLIVDSTKLNLESGFYCLSASSQYFYISAFTFPKLLSEQIVLQNQESCEWQFASSDKLYTVIQFQPYSPKLIFQYLNFTYIYDESNYLILKLSDQNLITINGNASIKVQYTNHPCYMETEPQIQYTDSLYIQLKLNGQCEPIQIEIHQGDQIITCERSLVIKQQLIMTTKNMETIHLISIVQQYQVTTKDFVYDYQLNLYLDDSNQYIFDGLLLIFTVLIVENIIITQQKNHKQRVEITRLKENAEMSNL